MKEFAVIGTLLFGVGMVTGMSIVEAQAKLPHNTAQEIKQNRLERRATEHIYQACVNSCKTGCLK